MGMKWSLMAPVKWFTDQIDLFLVVLTYGLKPKLKSLWCKVAALLYLGAIGVVFGFCFGVGFFPMWLLTRLF